MSLELRGQSVARSGQLLVNGVAGPAIDPPATALTRHLARELHDSVAQRLTLMLLQLEEFKADQTGRKSVLETADVLQNSMRAALGEVRAILYELRGDEVERPTFNEAVAELLSAFQATSGITVSVRRGAGWPEVMPPDLAVNLYRIIGEALNNVRFHSGARWVKVSFRRPRNAQLQITIRDNGVGFELESGRRTGGMGLVGMRERAMILGGSVAVVGYAPGTNIRVLLPWRGAA